MGGCCSDVSGGQQAVGGAQQATGNNNGGGGGSNDAVDLFVKTKGGLHGLCTQIEVLVLHACVHLFIYLFINYGRRRICIRASLYAITTTQALIAFVLLARQSGHVLFGI